MRYSAEHHMNTHNALGVGLIEQTIPPTLGFQSSRCAETKPSTMPLNNANVSHAILYRREVFVLSADLQTQSLFEFINLH